MLFFLLLQVLKAKKTGTVHPAEEAVFPMALELHFNLEKVEGIKGKCWK